MVDTTSQNMNNHQHLKRKPYYLAQFDDSGVLEHSNLTDQFIVEINSEVRFKLRSGSVVSNQACLLINKPLVLEDSTLQYTVTQPRVHLTQIADPDEDGKHLTAEFKQREFKGSDLDTEYLERVEPYMGDGLGSLNLEFRVMFRETGSFFVQLEYFDESIGHLNYSEPQYINVEPILVLQGQQVKCKQLSIMTVLSRCLGPINRWDQVLQNISQLGYNAVHFTPIQQYGSSYSHYSLQDQTLIADCFYEDSQNVSQRQRSRILQEQVNRIRNDYKLLSVIDIVLNHTANNSPWLYDHPEAGYNTDNCPHLYSAYVLDKALSDFSDRYANKQVSECPAAPYIYNEGDLQKVMHMIRDNIIPGLKLHEYFQCNINEQIQQVEQYFKATVQANASTFGKDEPVLAKVKRDLTKNKNLGQLNLATLLNEQLTEGHGSGPNPFNVQLKMPEAAIYFYEISNQNVNQALQKLRDALGQHNAHWQGMVQGFMGEALGAIEGTVRYYKIELKRHLITTHAPPADYKKTGPAEYEGNQIVTRYFTELNNLEQSKLAHNGWIMNADPLRDFALEGWHYLRRSINIWGDSVKLRYGNCPADSPFLWKHMSDYVTEMAQIFDGFRLDNAHSTPIHVCQYLLQVARTQNINLYVMAELFTSSAEADAYFVRKLNLNGLVREIQSTYNGRNLGEYFHKRTCQEAVLGRIDREFEDISSDGGITGQTYEVLKPTKPSDIIYDTTHDNPTMLEKFKTSRMALPMIGVISMADQAIATTWGYDQLIPKNLNVVTESRFYDIDDYSSLYKFDGKDINDLNSISHKHINGNGNGKLNGEHENDHQENKKEPIDFEYEFVFRHGSAKNIQLAGEFTEWQPAYQLIRQQNSDRWTLKLDLPLKPNASGYQYKFVVDGNWLLNREFPIAKDNNGIDNNYVSFPGQNNIEAPSRNFSSESAVFKDLSYARWKLNQVHEECTMNNAEIFMHQQSDDVIVVVRQFELDYSDSFDAYVSITRSCYYQEGGDYKYQTAIELPGFVTEVVLAGFLEINNSTAYNQFYQDKELVKGAQSSFKVFKSLDKFCSIQKLPSNQREQLIFHEMPPGFTCILKTKCPDYMKQAIKKLNHLQMLDISSLSRQFFRETPISAINHVLFRCDTEENDISGGKRGPYGLPNQGQFVYAGITSVVHLLRQLKVSGDMGHELFNNIRDGDWLLAYTIDRLVAFMGEELKELIAFLREYQKCVVSLNPTYKPKMVSRLIEKVYNAAVYNMVNMRVQDEFINDTNDIFLQKLALSSAQMYGRVPSAYFKDQKDTLCAGLPHFATGFMRCWGRDTFIALRGLYTVLGHEQEAKETILYFAKVMRHGLIPNLHDQGNNTRFNARDATWFFLQAIKDFIENSKESTDILQERFELQFPEQGKPSTLTLEDLIQEILQAHAQGIQFRERNAGQKIDAHMRSEGFDVRIVMERETGFCVGGNQYNCGTWMDKMGSSDKTHNRGIPATPRDGAPIELVGLQYSVLTFLHKLHSNDKFKYNSVVQADGVTLTYEGWAKRMKQYFEQSFWVPQDESEDQLYNIQKQYVHRRGIYKDTYQSFHKYTDYQLRPNLCIAMAVAPELFVAEHALQCLKMVENLLMTPNCMGIKTLDPGSDHYKGDYVNSDDTCGWNYHQGPEWVWPVGYFLIAKLKFTPYESKQQAIQDIMKWVIPHQKHLQENAWESLPELTNSNGKHCPDSCTAQAWSVSTIIDAMRELYYYQPQ